jgi:heterodisulfide reductase subunit A
MERWEMAESGPNAVLVVGGGIAGIQAALDLAESGVKVYLVEEDNSIGGKMAQLDKTFPTNDCSICILAPKMADCYGHPNIDVMTRSKVIGLEGEEGDFKAKVIRKATYVERDLCTGCGDCIEKCPVKGIVDYWELGLSTRKAIYIQFPQAVPRTAVIDPEHCLHLTKGKCGICSKVCKRDAINYDMEDEEMDLEVASVVLCPGFDEFDAKLKKEYSYEFSKNVVTSREFERILSAAGPFEGQVLRPSDEQHPKRIAFLQCVGSRDDKVGNTYCSSVCCMHALKAAIIAREHADDIESHIFFMDIRAVGKEFEDYRIRAETEYGVKIHRGTRVASVEETESENLLLRWSEGTELLEDEFDLVVLSVGFCPPAEAKEMSETFGIDLNRYGFCQTDSWSPLSTSRKGIYVSGTFAAPKDIPTSVAEASGVAAKACSSIRGRETVYKVTKDLPPERDISGEDTKIGVFVCHCGKNIGSVVDVGKVVKYANGLPGVEYAVETLYACAQDTLELIKEKIEELGLNRIVVASCSPRTHEPLFQNTIMEAGLNPYLFEMANIRDQCSWVHMQEPKDATEKAMDLVSMAVSKVTLVDPLVAPTFPVGHSAAVIGGGLAGMTAALELASNGYDVDLVEREGALGGNLARVKIRTGGKTGAEIIDELGHQIMENDRITVHLGTEIEDVTGFVGNFVLHNDAGNIETGAIVVATGAEEYRPTEYMYGEDDRVVTQLELAEMLAQRPVEANTIAMIQCVGSRTEDNPMCSRVCCTTAISNAIEIKRQNPSTDVYIFMKDIRTYGFREDLYREAGQLGVKFIKMPEPDMPLLEKQGDELVLTANDCMLSEEVSVNPDMVILSTGIRPRQDNDRIAKMLKVPISKDGFFLEAHMKLRPVDFATEGIYLAGLAHWPKFSDETIAQAAGAAARAMTVISKDELEGTAWVPVVDEELCQACGTCEMVCAFRAVTLKENESGIIKASVNPALCKGCGSCCAVCPTGAISIKHFTDDQIMAAANAILEEVRE